MKEPTNPDGTPARWWRQFLSAVRLNAGDAWLWHIAQGRMSGNDLEALEDAAKYVREVLPYKFTGAQRVLELEASIRRGYGACADATAAICAVALMRNVDVDVCYEELDRSPGSDHGYAHVRVALGDARVDAYPDASLDVPQCAGRFRVTREVARWPAAAQAPIRTSSPPAAGLLVDKLPEDGER